MEAPVKGRGRIWGVVALAVAIRLVLLRGRGDYVASDEGWYLLLARSLWSGEGYTLIGSPHITLSPLFPILAGGLGRLCGDWLWGGRLVAAVASGLVVLPVWALVRRWTEERTALTVAAILAVTPSMAPFVAAYWVGADLWVGAEPLLHLGLYAGLAWWVRAFEDGDMRRWALAGASLSLAFLARPEAVGVVGVVMVWSMVSALRGRSRARLAGVALLLGAFTLVASPYWVRIHRLTGEWRLTGREVAAASALRLTDTTTRSAAGDIETMLMSDDGAYERRLYALDASGYAMRSAYWGVGPGLTADPDAGDQRPGAGQALPVVTDTTGPAPSRGRLLLRAARLAATMVLPGWAWVLVGLGLLVSVRRARSASEYGAVSAVLATSATVGLVAAFDARTQLFLVPLLVLWMVRGVDWLSGLLERRVGALRPGFLRGSLLLGIFVGSLGTLGWQLWMSLRVGSPHHIVGAQNRRVGEALDSLLGGRPGPIASWHPAIALFADRDWRPLPLAPLADVVRYEQRAGAVGIVYSAYYPPTRGEEILGARYAVMAVPGSPTGRRAWSLVPVGGDSLIVLAELREVGRAAPPTDR